MTYCIDFFRKFKKEGNFCGLDKSQVSRLTAYLEIVELLMKQKIPEEQIYENLTVNAAEPLITARDQARTEGLNFVTAKIKSGEKVKSADLQSKLEKFAPANPRPKKSCRSATSPTDKKPDPSPVPPVEKQPETRKPVAGFEHAHDGKPVDPPRTVSELEKGVRKDEIRQAEENQLPAPDTLHPASQDWTPETCKKVAAGSCKCPDGECHVVREQQRGHVCQLWNLPINQISQENGCHIIQKRKREFLASQEGRAAVAVSRLEAAKPIRGPGIKITKTPLTCEELNRCADDLIERSGFFTEKEVGLVDELVRAHYENIHTRADFLKKAANWFLTKAEEES